MPTAKAAAITAATAAAPEIAIPVREALAIAGSLRSRSPRSEVEAKGDVVVVPPPERSLLIELRKAKYRVVRRGGVRIVTVDPAKGLTTTETVVVGTLGLAAYGIYLAAHAVQQDLSAVTHPLGKNATWYEPWTWGH